MVTQVTDWLINAMVAYWKFLATGGIVGISIIVLIVLRKLAALIRHFTN